MKYAKLKNETLLIKEFENGMEVGGGLTEQQAVKEGYKPVCEVEQPSDAEFCVYKEYDVCFVQIWKRADEEHAGTQEDPIPYNPPMEIFEGKYYIQNEVIYKCTRNSDIPLSHDLSALVGTYVELV